MATDCITQLTFEGDRFPKPTVVAFDQECSSSDGGLILLQALDAKLGLTDALAACLRDDRQPGKVQHPLVDLLRQRVFGLAAGYPDCNDAARLADDPMHKLALGRDPLDGASLGSQPTLSRFENAVTRPALGRMLHVLADTVIATQQRRRGRRRVRRITIDLDVTDDPTHGQQEFAFFSGHYGCWHYLPLLATLTFDDDPEQYLVGAILRPGNTGAVGTLGWLRRLVSKLRRAFPRARLRVRLDGGFAGNPLLEFLETSGLEYVVAVGRNARLERLAGPSPSRSTPGRGRPSAGEHRPKRSMMFYDRRTQAVLRRPVEPGQYTSIAFGARCREEGVRPSMGSVGDAYDNALCESFFATLECELLDRECFRTQADARLAIFDFIEGWYNPRRRHSSLDYLSPMIYETRHGTGDRPVASGSTIAPGAAISVPPSVLVS